MTKKHMVVNKYIQKVSICIATYNMEHLIYETIKSCQDQDYPNKEIIVYDDCSTDGTNINIDNVRYIRGKNNLGVGEAFNEAIRLSTGSFVLLMCADDLFTNGHVISDMVSLMMKGVGHVSRYYYQFQSPDKRPVRAWRTRDILMLSNNPSGLMYRKEALKNARCSNKMFIETSKLTHDVLRDGWDYRILSYDTIAVRVHDSTSTQKGYYLKHRVSSPVLDWYNLGCKEVLKDYVSLVQIKANYKLSAVFEEIWNFIRLRPLNLLSHRFWFFAVATIVIPRSIIRKLPKLYRTLIGRMITKCVTPSSPSIPSVSGSGI